MKYLAPAIAAVLLSACAGQAPVSRALDDGLGWAVTDVRVSVPETLTVSENPRTRFPGTDIVWWEDPEGDRRAQVAALIEDAATDAVGGGGTPVALEIEVVHFHAVTPMARSGGFFSWHDIALDVTPVDGATGSALAETTRLEIWRNAFAGARAERAMARGETQRVRISEAIVEKLNRYLAAQGG